MRSKSPKSDAKFDDITNDQTYLLQPWHHGEPTESWWLNQDRQHFSERAKQERNRMNASAMARRIGGQL